MCDVRLGGGPSAPSDGFPFMQAQMLTAFICLAVEVFLQKFSLSVNMR